VEISISEIFRLAGDAENNDDERLNKTAQYEFSHLKTG